MGKIKQTFGASDKIYTNRIVCFLVFLFIGIPLSGKKSLREIFSYQKSPISFSKTHFVAKFSQNTNDTALFFVKELHEIKHPTLYSNIYLLAGSGIGEQIDYWRPIRKPCNLYTTRFSAGLSLHNWVDSKPFFDFGLNMAYQYKKNATEYGLPQSGIDSHWIRSEFYFTFIFFVIGFGIDFFLDATINNPDHFTYNGLYKDCFNSVIPSFFLGFSIPMPFVRMEFRINGNIIPSFNVRNVTWHNYNNIFNIYKNTDLGVGSYASLCVRLYVPLWTSENKIQASTPRLSR